MNITDSKAMSLIAVVVAALLVGAAVGYFFSRRTEAPAQAHTSAPQVERKVLYWRDPMVPGARFDKPGKSPFMDMELVPVYADDPGNAAVRIDPNVIQNLGVRLGQVERKALDAGLEAVGAVAFDERLLEVVQARVAGYVTRLHVKAPLMRVKRGQALFDILSPEWQAAQQDYLALLDAQSPSMQSIRDAARQRLIVLGVPETTIVAIERTHKTHATTTISAPVSGVLSELTVREGGAFIAGAPLARINGLETVWANAQVPEAQVSLVREGSQVSARATAWPGAEFHGRVIALLPDVDPQTRTLAVRVALDNATEKLAPGMFVSVAFSAAEVQPHLVVPSEAVIVTGKRTVVIAARDRGFDVIEVATGREARGYTTILSGLEEGQSIVVSGQFLIDSEASLRSTIERLSAPSPQEQRDEETDEHAHHQEEADSG
jgi:membrane fusion protein, copper/silver efflux system